MDFLCAIPFFSIFRNVSPYARLWLLSKVVRIYRGVELLNTYVFMNQLKQIGKKRIKKIILEDSKKANDRIKDQNFIS